ncbi:hypothetical protein HN011_003652 [Eciton burchellii]|nr:hypothetical protein HN011_003652 [Eciton burchellii]
MFADHSCVTDRRCGHCTSTLDVHVSHSGRLAGIPPSTAGRRFFAIAIAYYPPSVQRAGTEKRRVPFVCRHIVHYIPAVGSRPRVTHLRFCSRGKSAQEKKFVTRRPCPIDWLSHSRSRLKCPHTREIVSARGHRQQRRRRRRRRQSDKDEDDDDDDDVRSAVPCERTEWLVKNNNAHTRRVETAVRTTIA